MKILIVDFETRSNVDIKTAGADRYFRHNSTEVLCAGFCLMSTSDKREWLWYPSDGPLPEDLVDVIENCDYIAAVNARFDQGIWEFQAVNRYQFPEVRHDKWYCISAQLRVNALPASLDNACKALKVPHQKNKRGMYLIQQLSIPPFSQDPKLLVEMGGYCMDDVRASKDVMNGCRILNPIEHSDWIINEKINDRGILVDLMFAEAAQKLADKELLEISAKVETLSSGTITKPTQRERIKNFIVERVDGHVEKLMLKIDKGVRKHTLDKEARERIFARLNDGSINMPDDARQMLECYDQANMSSVAKFKRMIEMADPWDHRVRGAFVYAGASTLRFTSRGLQLHNFKRDCLSEGDFLALRDVLINDIPHQFSVMDQLGQALRPTIHARKGHKLIINDWSGIENRMLPWLSGDPRAEKKLDLFREIDADPKAKDTYVRAAEDAGLTDRQVGKVIELSLGFLGGKGAFNAMAKNYGVHLPDHEVERIVKAWRAANPWAVDFGDALERAAMRAVRNPFSRFKAGRVSYEFDGYFLQCTLPSDTVITYPDVRIEWDLQFERHTLTALKANWTPAQGDYEWPRFKLWRGLLAENVTQAECATLLREALYDCDGNDLPVVLHCHDEIVLEVEESRVQIAARHLQSIMQVPSPWAVGLPLKAVPTICKVYGK